MKNNNIKEQIGELILSFLNEEIEMDNNTKEENVVDIKGNKKVDTKQNNDTTIQKLMEENNRLKKEIETINDNLQRQIQITVEKDERINGLLNNINNREIDESETMTIQELIEKGLF